jgi:hypothetical protein
MTRIVGLVAALALAACASSPVPEPRPNASEGTSYHLAGGGTNLLACNTWGFDTICRTSGR